MNPKDNLIQRAISNVKQTAGRIFQQAPQAANTYVNAYQKVSSYVPFAPQMPSNKPSPIVNNVVKPILTSTYNSAKPIIDYVDPRGYAAERTNPGLGNKKLTKAIQAMPGTAVNLYGLSKLTPASTLLSAGLGGALSKITGGSFTAGAKSGLESAPMISAISSFTNPYIQMGTNTVAGKFTNPLAQQITGRIASGIGNIPEGYVMGKALGRKNYGGTDAALDFLTGVAFQPPSGGIRVKGAMGRTPTYLDPEDAGYYYRAQDILNDRKSTSDQIKQAKNVVFNLAERYLSPQERPSSGGVKQIIKALEDKANNSNVNYGDSPFIMGVSGGNRAKGSDTEQGLYHGSNAKVGKDNTSLLTQATRKYRTIHEGGKLKTVEGTPIQVAEGLDTFIHKGTGGWVISEGSSGRYMATGKTPEEALLNAKKSVNDIGINNVKRIIAQNQLSKDTLLKAKIRQSKQLPPLRSVIEADNKAKIDTTPNYTPITIENGKVSKLSPKENLSQLLNGTSQRGVSVPEQRGRLMAEEVKSQDPFIKGLEHDQVNFNNTPTTGGNGGKGGKPPINGPQFTQADADQAAGRAQEQAERNYKGFQDIFAKFIGKRDVAKTLGVQTGAKFRDIPEDLGPSVIRNIETPDSKASPDIAKYSQRIRQEFDNLYKDAKDAGIEMGYLENYITHIWNRPQEEVQAIYKSAKQRGFFQNDRVVPTYDEGLEMGLMPKYTTPQQILGEYSRKLEEVKANVELFKQLKKEGMVVDSAVGAGRPGFEPLTGPGFPRSFSGRPDGRQVQGFYYAPREIARVINRVFSPEDVTGAGKVFEFGQKASGKIQDITMSGGVPATPLNAFTAAQMTKEILSGRVKSPITSLVRGISSKSSYQFFEKNVEQIKKMQARNIPVTSNFDVENLVSKATINRTLGDKIGNIWNKTVNEPTFKRFMPMLQVNLFNDIEAQALKGGANAEQAADIAAQAVKNFYGITGTNITAQRSKIGQDMLGTVFFAPKFRESMVNFWINNVKSIKNPTALENRANIKFMVGATLLFAGMNKLNQDYNNGKNMWENPPGKEDKLLIPLGNGTTIGIPFLSSIATLPRAGFKMAKNAATGNFPQVLKEGKTFLSSAVRPPLDVLTNENYFGSEIYGEGDSGSDKAFKIGKYLLGQYQHPYIKEAINSIGGKNSLAQSASQALELPIRFYKDKTLNASTYYAARDNAVKRLSPQEKAAFEAIPKYDANDPLTEMFKYQIYLKYPAVFNAKREIAVSTAQNGQVDPLYTVPVDIAKSYILYQSLPPGSQDAKDLRNATPQIIDLMNMRSRYFDANPIDGLGNESKRPKPSQYVQQQMDVKNWKDPEVRAYLDANTAYTNQERAKLGLTPLAGFQNYAKKPKAAPKLKKISMPKVKIKKAKIRVKMPKLKKIKIGGKTKKNKIRLTSSK